MNKQFWKAALIRAARTVAQNLASTLPVGVPVTVAMVKGFDMEIIWCVLAWLATGLLGGVNSLLTSIATGLPEVDLEAVVKAAQNEKDNPTEVKAEPEIRVVYLDSEDEYTQTGEGRIVFLNNEENREDGGDE